MSRQQQHRCFNKNDIRIILKSCLTLKVVSATFLLVCFKIWTRALIKFRKMVFISLQNLFSFLRKSNFRILHFQISWRHQIPKHKTRNTFHWIKHWSEHSVLMKFRQFLAHYKRKNVIKNFCKTCGLKTSSRPFYVCKELGTASIENEIFEATYLY